MRALAATGNVVIGNVPTLSTQQKLEVKGSISLYDGDGNTSLFLGREQQSIMVPPATDYGEWGIQYWSGASKGTANGNNGWGGLNFWKPFGSTGTTGNGFLYLQDDGSVGIGTANPAYPLDVNGTIRSNEVKVCVNGCDFVFDKNYNLISIDSLNSYINQNHHLPGIASAKQMETEGNVSLGQMDSQLLQKVEELTLYIVQQQQQAKHQDEKINELEKKLNALVK